MDIEDLLLAILAITGPIYLMIVLGYLTSSWGWTKTGWSALITDPVEVVEGTTSGPTLINSRPRKGTWNKKKESNLPGSMGDITTIADSSEAYAPDIAIEQPRAELLMRVEPQQIGLTVDVDTPPPSLFEILRFEELVKADRTLHIVQSGTKTMNFHDTGFQ